ncbi:hypothetical protein HQ584_07750 [Patescibacteria group bacterium]|nr:hypothetical protein [Patescibacteria group bacterium]
MKKTAHVYFVSTDQELKLLQQDMAKNNLKGAIAVFLPFYKKSKNKTEIDRIVSLFKTVYFLPVFVYGLWDTSCFKIASRWINRQITNCDCAWISRKSVKKENEDVGTISAEQGRKKTEVAMRGVVVVALNNL